MTTASATCVQIQSQRQNERFFFFGPGPDDAARARRLHDGGRVVASSMLLASAERAVAAPFMRLATFAYSTSGSYCALNWCREEAGGNVSPRRRKAHSPGHRG